MTTTVLLLGATGFVGNAVLHALRTSKDENGAPDHFDTSVIIRDESKASILRDFGVNVIVGSLSDKDLVERLASQSDIVINCANADLVDPIAPIVSGLKIRKTVTGRTGVYVHCSGTGPLHIDLAGEESPKVWDDSDPSDFWELPDTASHRWVDNLVAQAGMDGDVKTIILVPSVIYGGLSRGPIPRQSWTLPRLIQAAITNKQAVYVGKGQSRVDGIHVQDLGDLHVWLAKTALNDLPTPIKIWGGKHEGFFYTTTDQFTWKELAEVIGRQLFARGLVSTPEAVSVVGEDARRLLGSYAEATFTYNCRTITTKLPKLGWKPIHGEATGHGLLQPLGMDAEIDGVLSGAPGSDLIEDLLGVQPLLLQS